MLTAHVIILFIHMNRAYKMIIYGFRNHLNNLIVLINPGLNKKSNREASKEIRNMNQIIREEKKKE